MSQSQQDGFTAALAQLNQTHPAEAQAIASSIQNGNLAVGNLVAAPGQLGASDGDTMLINWPRTTELEDAAALLLHEWNHVALGQNGLLGPCSEAVNYAQSGNYMAAYACDGNHNESVCARTKQHSFMAAFMNFLCWLITGNVASPPVTVPPCC